MRDHFEGTPLDMTKDIGAGPFEVPYRWRPMTFTVDSTDYTHERAIATQQTGFSFVASVNDGRHDAMRGILWFGVDDANTCVYVPVFNSTPEAPRQLAHGNGDMYTISWDAMFWTNNYVANQAYNRYSQMIGDIRRVQSGLEDGIGDAVAKAATEIAPLDYAAAQSHLAEVTNFWTAKATTRISATISWSNISTAISRKKTTRALPAHPKECRCSPSSAATTTATSARLSTTPASGSKSTNRQSNPNHSNPDRR